MIGGVDLPNSSGINQSNEGKLSRLGLTLWLKPEKKLGTYI